MVGFLGAWSYQLVDVAGRALGGTEDILKVLDAKADPATSCRWVAPQPLLQYSIVGWSFLGFVPQIPVQAINVRYNLQSGGICRAETAFFWGVVAPWIGTAFLYQREVSRRAKGGVTYPVLVVLAGSGCADEPRSKHGTRVELQSYVSDTGPGVCSTCSATALPASGDEVGQTIFQGVLAQVTASLQCMLEECGVTGYEAIRSGRLVIRKSAL